MPPVRFSAALRPVSHPALPRPLAQHAVPSRRLRASAWAVLALAAGLAPAAQAAVQFVQIPATQAWSTITQVGPVPVLPFELPPQAAIADLTTGITTIPGLPSPATGSLTVSPAVEKRTMPNGGWGASWANNYVGPVFRTSQLSNSLTLPPRTRLFTCLRNQTNMARWMSLRPPTAEVRLGRWL